MDALEELMIKLKGDYECEKVTKGHTFSGTFIMQNSSGLIKKENYYIQIYCSSNMGVRAVNTIDGSPYELLLFIPFVLKKTQSIFPKNLFQRLLTIKPNMKAISAEVKKILKRYNFKGNIALTNYILKNKFLTKTLPKHTLYITTTIKKEETILTLRPNESVLNVHDLEILYKIMDELGSVIIKHELALKEK